MYRMLAVSRVLFSFNSQETIPFCRSKYLHFMYPHMHCCLLCCVGAWFVKLFYLLGFQHFYALCKHTLRQGRRVLCVCVYVGTGRLHNTHKCIHRLWRLEKVVHTTKSKKTKVILFAKSIGTFLGLNIWWTSPRTIHRFYASLAKK